MYALFSYIRIAFNMNKSIIKQVSNLLFTCFNERDFGRVKSYVSEKVVLNFPGAGDISGKRRTLLFVKTLLRKYPQLEFYVSEIIVENNRAVAVWTNKGKDAEGNDYSNSGLTLFHFEEERIVFISDYFKDTSFTDN